MLAVRWPRTRQSNLKERQALKHTQQLLRDGRAAAAYQGKRATMGSHVATGLVDARLTVSSAGRCGTGASRDRARRGTQLAALQL